MAKPTVLAVGEGRQTAFLKSGVTVPEKATVAQALALAGLDWEVAIAPAAAMIGGKPVVADHRFAVYRKDTGQIFDFVGQGYEVIQTADALGAADPLRKEGGFVFQTAGELAGGRVSWVQLKMLEGFSVAGEDPYDLYALLETSHDGKRAVRYHITPIRLDCLNMLNQAIQKAEQRMAVRHTRSAEVHLADAKQAIGLTEQYVKAFDAEMQGLLGHTMGEKALGTFLDKLLPERKKKDEEKAQITALALEAPTCEFGRGTRYAALQAVREYYDHVRPQRTAESSFIGAVTGVNRRMTDRALDMLR